MPKKKDPELDILEGRIYYLVDLYFKGDRTKVGLWYHLANPLLGGVSPNFMLEVGRHRKLLAIVEESVEGDKPMQAKCPKCLGNPEKSKSCEKCKGTGFIEVQIASGDLYSYDCTDCGRNIGGCIVGGNSPLQKPPEAKPCPSCKGKTKYTKALDVASTPSSTENSSPTGSVGPTGKKKE